MTPPRIRIRDAGRRAVPPLLFTAIAIMVVTLAVLATSCPAARPTSYGTPSTTAGPAVAATTTPTIVNLSFQPGTIRVRVEGHLDQSLHRGGDRDRRPRRLRQRAAAGRHRLVQVRQPWHLRLPLQGPPIHARQGSGGMTGVEAILALRSCVSTTRKH
jgi:hypothetical protein